MGADQVGVGVGAINLAARWLAPAAAVGARGDLAGAGADLLARWAQPHRRYHDLRHLAAVLDRVDLVADSAADPDAVRLGAWFHDAVYDPRAGDNEALSAALAQDVLGALRLPTATIDEVTRLVLVTRTHEVATGDGNAAALCDADLGVLADNTDGYAAYAAAVREEYSHVTDADFVTGRAEVLRSLLEREPLFHTAFGRTHWETRARRNMTDELAGY